MRSEQDRPGSQASLRSLNQHRIVQLLEVAGELTQAQLARRTGLAPATVSNIVRDLIGAGVLSSSAAGGRGRALSLTRAAGMVIGIDHGHRHITVVICDLDHVVLAERRVDLDPNVPARVGLNQVKVLFEQLLEDVGASKDEVVGVGMGLPAPVNFRTGAVGAPSILPGWFGVRAAELASESLGVQVVVDNDANLGVLAEYLWGAGQGCENLAYLKLSEGVGAGLLVAGELLRGRDGTAGEIGHITMDEFGSVCRCGNRGCLETVVAARSVVGLLAATHGADLSIADVVRLAESGDIGCERVLADTGRQAGVAVADLANLFNPDRIVIGGELAVAGELLLAPLREVVRRRGIPSATSNLQIVPAELGSRASVLGAVALAMFPSGRAHSTSGTFIR